MIGEEEGVSVELARHPPVPAREPKPTFCAGRPYWRVTLAGRSYEERGFAYLATRQVVCVGNGKALPGLVAVAIVVRIAARRQSETIEAHRAWATSCGGVGDP